MQRTIEMRSVVNTANEKQNSAREGATEAKFAVEFVTKINSYDINRNQLKTEMEIATEISQQWRERLKWNMETTHEIKSEIEIPTKNETFDEICISSCNLSEICAGT